MHAFLPEGQGGGMLAVDLGRKATKVSR